MDPAKYPAIRHVWPGPGPGPDPPKKCRVPGGAGAGAGYPVGHYSFGARPSWQLYPGHTWQLYDLCRTHSLQ